jgi:hypothetical protein
LFYSIEKDNSLLKLYPTLCEEWDYEKYENLSPKMFTKGSNRKVWWKCSKGHSWQTKINNRTSLGTGCPICGRLKASQNKKSKSNERLLKNHDLFKEFDKEKNENINIETLRVGSKNMVWWKCEKCNHSWQAQIYTRIQGFGKCPNC